MIRLACPKCKSILSSPDHSAGDRMVCPKCGQQLRVPNPVKPVERNETMLAQPLPVSHNPLTGSKPDWLEDVRAVESNPPPKIIMDADIAPFMPAQHLAASVPPRPDGLSKHAELEGGGGKTPDYKPARSWAGTAFVALALILAVTAMPAAVIHLPLLGVGLAAFGVAFALFAAFTSLSRKGLGLAAVALMVGGSVLFSIVVLAGGPEGLLRPVKDRIAALHTQDSQEQRVEHSYRLTQRENKGSESKSEANQTGHNLTDEELQRKGAPKSRKQRHEEEEVPRNAAPKRDPPRHEEKAEDQSSPKPTILPNPATSSSLDRLREVMEKADQRFKATAAKRKREPAPTEAETQAKEGPELDPDEERELNRWIMNLRTDVGSPNDNPIRYRTFLEKAREKAQAYTREFVARKVWVDVNFSVVRIDEDQIHLDGGFGLYLIDSQDHRGRNRLLFLRVGQDISKERALELRRGQNLLVRVDVVDVAVEESNRSPYVKFTVKNVRLPEKNEEAEPKSARKKEASHKEERPNPKEELPQFDPHDLERTNKWAEMIVARLRQDENNAIRYRTSLEKLSKEMSVHKDTKVRWVFKVTSIGEGHVDLSVVHNLTSLTLTSAVEVGRRRQHGPLHLIVGQGISNEKAAKMNPGDEIAVSAEVHIFRVNGPYVHVVLKDLQEAEERKQPR